MLYSTVEQYFSIWNDWRHTISYENTFTKHLKIAYHFPNLKNCLCLFPNHFSMGKIPNQKLYFLAHQNVAILNDFLLYLNMENKLLRAGNKLYNFLSFNDKISFIGLVLAVNEYSSRKVLNFLI
jgi:hypothetical protein